jgi:hypothetical protein
MAQTTTPSPDRKISTSSDPTARPEKDEGVADSLGRAIGEVVTSPASTEDPALDDALTPGVGSKPPPPAKPGAPQLS